MVVASAAITLAMWTNKFHHLIYLDYGFKKDLIHNLVFKTGDLYYLVNSYPFVCMTLAIAMLLYQIKKSEIKYRKRFLILLICLIIPFVAQAAYIAIIMAGIFDSYIYFTPFSLTIMSLCLYLGVVRFNIFDIISVAIETAMEHIREGFVLLDENNNYLLSNPAAIKIIPGITKLRKGESIFSSADWPGELANLDDLDRGLIEFSAYGENVRYFKASISPVFADNKTMMAKIILIGETTDSVNLLKEMENVAYIDALTGLYNRKHFSELANADIERAQRLNQTIYTAMLDLDFFKNVNDTFGHAAGDMILKTTAGVIRQTIRA
jgi:predicted signal transduction protein with EAL and GGDEF domain